jgi:hypothetical protein
MSERATRTPEPGKERRFDEEIDVRAAVYFGLALAGMTAVALVAAWILFGALRRQAAAGDPALSPLRAAAERRLPPEPRLQTTPEGDLRSLRAEEEERLTSYGWVDAERGVVRIPIERAIEITAERGLPARGAVETATGARP